MQVSTRELTIIPRLSTTLPRATTVNNLSLNENFAEARIRVLGDKISPSGIGTYSEKSLHKILKNTLEPSCANHEISHLGFVADIKNADGIIEIQTKALKNLRDKLAVFLPDCKVTVVYPMYKNTYRHKITADGEIGARRLSSKHHRICDCAFELYNIREYIKCDNLKILLLFLSVEEYMREGIELKVAGKRRTRERVERIPYRIEEAIELSSPQDYLKLLPEGLADSFSISDINRAWGKRFKHAYSIVSILKSLDLLTEGVKLGREIKYSIKEK